jgi:hypothetical protein
VGFNVFSQKKFSCWCSSDGAISEEVPMMLKLKRVRKKWLSADAADLRTLGSKVFYNEVLTAKSYQRKEDVLLMSSQLWRRVSGASQLMGYDFETLTVSRRALMSSSFFRVSNVLLDRSVGLCLKYC